MAEHDMASDSLLAGNIIRSVRILVVSEVFGAEASAFAERHARDAAQRRIWAVLHELERQTRDAIYDRLGDTAGRFATAARIANASGTANGAAVMALPHRLQMRSLVVATKPFLPHFRKLDRHFAGSPWAAFFHYVLAHELAIAELGRRVLADHDEPLAPVEALLGNVPR
ncbi:hypothetical protein [Mycobacterium sp.]|uniref:hypothetical protein n=1 Tax=Mycobacterium sp. TaxID=1785 RepID=UPI003F961CD7